MFQCFARKGQIDAANDGFLTANFSAGGSPRPGALCLEFATQVGLFRNLTEIFAELVIHTSLTLVMDVR